MSLLTKTVFFLKWKHFMGDSFKIMILKILRCFILKNQGLKNEEQKAYLQTMVFCLVKGY